MTSCYFANLEGWGPCRFRADGLPDRVHLIPKRRLKRERPNIDPWDDRTWVLGCRHHHHLLDNGFRRLSLSQHPPAFLAFVQDEGLFWDESRHTWICASQEAA